MKTVLIVLVVLVAGFAGFVATRPASFHVERSAAMKAPSAAVYALVEDFHKWPTWSPWEKRDPAMKREHTGAAHGEGATYAWSGNKEAGSGSMTITSARPTERIVIKLEFTAPMKATNTATFSFKEHAGQTIVLWSMDGENDFVGKAFCLFFDMDKLVGGDFEQGLAAMKAAAEADAAKLDAAAAEAAKAAKDAENAAAAPTDAAPAP